MNRILFFWVVTACFLSLTNAQEAAELTTADGTTYTSVKVVRVERGQAVISHSGGIASVDLANLPKSFRVANGLQPGLEETKAIFREALQNWIAGYSRLNTQYERALQSLEEKLAADGNVEQSKAVKAERESFRTVMRTDLSPIEKLAKGQTSYRDFKGKWEAENSAKLVILTGAYLRALEEVVQRSTKEDKIEEAVATKAEIARFEGIAEDSDRIQILLGAGPAIVRVEASVTELSPDGNPADKKPGIMAMMTAGPQTDIILPTGSQYEDVIEMDGNWETWAALKSDGKLISSPLAGDGIPEDHKPVVWFRIGAGMVTAFHPDGGHSVFGDPKNLDDRPPGDLHQITQFELDRGSGIALTSEGNIRVWGAMYPDKAAREEIENQFEAVRFVGASENIAWAVKESGEVYSWQNGSQPERIGAHKDIASFRGGRSAYLVLLDDGTLEGGAPEEQENPIIHVPENLRSGQAIRVDGWGYALQFDGGAWHTWGGPAESARLHSAAKAAGSLLDLEISAAPGRFMIMMLRRG